MYVFNVYPTKKTKKWLRDHKINASALGAALSLLISEIHPCIKVYSVKITLQILFNTDESMYQFKTNKLFICSTPYTPTDSNVLKQQAFFDHFLHEFRHWMQSKLFRIGTKQLSYTDDDVTLNTNAYYRNKLEVDARQFVRQNIKKFEKYYKLFSRTHIHN